MKTLCAAAIFVSCAMASAQDGGADLAPSSGGFVAITDHPLIKQSINLSHDEYLKLSLPLDDLDDLSLVSVLTTARSIVANQLIVPNIGVTAVRPSEIRTIVDIKNARVYCVVDFVPILKQEFSDRLSADAFVSLTAPISIYVFPRQR